MAPCRARSIRACLLVLLWEREQKAAQTNVGADTSSTSTELPRETSRRRKLHSEWRAPVVVVMPCSVLCAVPSACSRKDDLRLYM
jgi:hypothetical protein